MKAQLAMYALRAVRTAERIRWPRFTVRDLVILVLLAASLVFSAREINQLRGAVHASCSFAADLGSAPLAVNPKTGKASELGVKIVSDSRVQFRGLGCPGKLPPPQPSFVRWAKAYHLPSR